MTETTPNEPVDVPDTEVEEVPVTGSEKSGQERMSDEGGTDTTAGDTEKSGKEKFEAEVDRMQETAKDLFGKFRRVTEKAVDAAKTAWEEEKKNDKHDTK